MLNRRAMIAGSAAAAVLGLPAVAIDQDAHVREYARAEAARLREILHAIVPLTPEGHYSKAARYAFIDSLDAIGSGAEVDPEIDRYSLRAQLLREHYNVFLDDPTTARGFRHPSWPTTC